MIFGYKNRRPEPGEIHRVYRNLADRDGTQVWSILARRSGRWLVVGHADRIALGDVKFKVGQGGKARAILTGQRNVHAFAVGRLLDKGAKFWTHTRVTYSPFRNPTFVNELGRPVEEAPNAFFDAKGRVWI